MVQANLIMNTMHILQLEKTIHQNCTELEELDKLRSHIVTLIAYLDSQADEYLQNIHWQKK